MARDKIGIIGHTATGHTTAEILAKVLDETLAIPKQDIYLITKTLDLPITYINEIDKQFIRNEVKHKASCLKNKRRRKNKRKEIK